MIKGLYIHVPFCKSRCGYCDFYSTVGNEKLYNEYTEAVIKAASIYHGQKIDTIYIGGGTPSLLGTELLCRLLSSIYEIFEFCGDEITIEVNPDDDLDYKKLADEVFVNRLSFGVQSANEDELLLMNRRHTNEDVTRSIAAAKAAGIYNISLDLILSLPGSTPEKLRESIDFVISQDPTHISCYQLTVDEGCDFYKKGIEPQDSDLAADGFDLVKAELSAAGYERYEVSNFAKDGLISEHNMKYWRCSQYIGIGPAAHSFIDGKRLYTEPDLAQFLKNPTAPQIFDSLGGDAREYLTLALRTAEGVFLPKIAIEDKAFAEHVLAVARELETKGLIYIEDGSMRVYPTGDESHLPTMDMSRIKATDRGLDLLHSVILKFL